MISLKALNDYKWILNDQGGHSDSSEINLESLESFRTFRGSLFLEQKIGKRTTFLEAWYGIEGGVKLTCKDPSFAQTLVIFAN